MFKHSEDRLPVALVAALTALDFTLYFSVQSVWVLVAYWLLTVIPKGTVGAWSHHHQHVATFRSTPLNRALELMHALHTGMTSNLWVLHHVLGHHLNYLDQTKDESRWKRLDGTPMGALEYTLNVTLTAYPRAFHVGRRFPKHQRVFVLYTLLTVVVVALLVWARPLQALFVFVLPMITSLMFTSWVTHDHHAGLDTKDPYAGSMNTLNKRFNALTGNLGFHTAHHVRQGIHWSKLPAFHQQIAEKIPAHLYRHPDFTWLTGRDEVALEPEMAATPVFEEAELA